MTIGTCGHELSDDWRGSGKGKFIIKGLDRNCQRAVKYVILCENCETVYKRDKMFLLTETDINKWLAGEEDGG